MGRLREYKWAGSSFREPSRSPRQLLRAENRRFVQAARSIFRRIAAGALASVICFGIMPHVFTSGVAAGAAGLLTGVLVSAWVDDAVTALVIALPIGVGVALSGVFEINTIGIPNMLLSLCLAFSGGIILYLACGEILPDKKQKPRKSAAE